MGVLIAALNFFAALRVRIPADPKSQPAAE
jgi:hypothetical protein